MGSHGTWHDEAATSKLRILIDIEPAFTQMKMEKQRHAGEKLPTYDYYFTPARNIGTAKSPVPTAGREWRPLGDLVSLDLFPFQPTNPGVDAPFTTVMNWQFLSKPFEYEGKSYGSKDAEFPKFENLPQLTRAPLEIAVSGKNVPRDRLVNAGWRVRNAEEIAVSFESYVEYIRRSRGEFTVCKHAFVATHCGWFSDREAAYLASGRPVVMQDTGWSEYVPCGEGIFAVRTVEEAAAAIDEIQHDYARHSKAARAIAEEHFDAAKVLPKFLRELGL
jgi:hypothetical protein